MKVWISFISVILVMGGCVPESSVVVPKSQVPCLKAAQLNQYGYDYLEKVAQSLREDKKNIASFEVFINAMKGTVDNYSDMIESSVYISQAIRFLPIPYAGEVSNATKLVSKTVLSLGGAASVLSRYKVDTDLFLTSFDKINPYAIKTGEIVKLSQFADMKLLKDAKDLENSLKDISESTATMAATTQSIAGALETTGEYVNQAKSFIGFGQAQSNDKLTLTQNKNSINTKMVQLNQKIISLEKSGEIQRLNIAKARIYSELALQLEN